MFYPQEPEFVRVSSPAYRFAAARRQPSPPGVTFGYGTPLSPFAGVISVRQAEPGQLASRSNRGIADAEVTRIEPGIEDVFASLFDQDVWSMD